MRIVVLTVGTLGDVQPFVSLALALQAAGYDVRLATNSNFEKLVSGRGLDFAPLGVDSQAFLAGRQGRVLAESGNPVALVRNSLRLLRPVLERIHAKAWDACEDADAIVYHAYTLPTGHAIAKARGVRAVPATIYPSPTRAHPTPGVRIPSYLGGRSNLFTYWIHDQATWLVYRSSARCFPASAGRVPFRSPQRELRREGRPILCSYSPVVLPPPPDLPDRVHVTGYWFLDPDPDWRPDPALLDFLEAGPPPVYVGFGSMGDPGEARETTRTVLEALEGAGARGVIAAGWSGLGGGLESSKNIIRIENAPHTWLLPRMAAVVHHGGAGTTGAALAAGVPNVVVPHFGDQAFWGLRVQALGAGPEPIPRRALSVDRLARAIANAVADRSLRRQAAELGARIRSEDGTARAVEVIERDLARRA